MREIYVNGSLMRYSTDAELRVLLSYDIRCARRDRQKRVTRTTQDEMKRHKKPSESISAL
jgi:hypothetical protein